MGVISLLAITSCMFDLDVAGVFGRDDNVNERFTQSIQWNAENPKRITAINRHEYTVLFGGDSHVGGTSNLRRFIDLTHDSLAVAMVIAGDVSTGQKDDYHVLDSVLTMPRSVHTCLLVGNHDLYFDGWKSFFKMFGSSTYSMDVITPEGTDLYIFLDSGSGTLGPLQLDWLKKLLETERNSYRYVIITTHLNFFRNRMTGSTNPLNEELLVLLDMFEKHRVDLMISGHDHDRHIEHFGHTTYLTLDAMLDDVPQASYMKLMVSGDGLDYEFFKF